MDTTDEVRKPYSLRISDDLREWLKQRANENMRSMNAEINKLLQAMKEQIEQGTQG